MKITVLTSSRADYSIYTPLLKQLQDDNYFDLSIIAFGTHTSKENGYTIQNIIADGFRITHQVETLVNDTPKGITESIALTTHNFAAIWENEINNIDLIICLGDRYEMFAAVTASIPFNIPITHIHGGETTLGAIDNKFRHALTLMADYHFTSTEQHQKKVCQLTNSTQHVYNVGALSLDNLDNIQLLSTEAFKAKFKIDLALPTILITFHPETVSYQKNEAYTKELSSVFKQLTNYQLLITMPNADTFGNIIRKEFLTLSKKYKNIITVENLGLLGYFSAIKESSFLLGNTSSGIIEAASFNKYVINIGNRQKGRSTSKNVIHTPISQEAILNNIKKVEQLPAYTSGNIYKGATSASLQIIEILKNDFK